MSALPTTNTFDEAKAREYFIDIMLSLEFCESRDYCRPTGSIALNLLLFASTKFGDLPAWSVQQCTGSGTLYPREGAGHRS